MASEITAKLREKLGDQVQENILLETHTSARIGGPADVFITARSKEELAEAAQICWNHGTSFTLIGGGSNILVSDRGIRGVVIHNKAKAVEFRSATETGVWAESGVMLSNLAHRCAVHGLAGLEWAATVPGTIGGAVYGNAGAFGSDIAHNLLRAEILTETGYEWWPVEQMEYSYRASILKHGGPKAIILSAEFRLTIGESEKIKSTIEQFTARRKASQPPGASMGSMFKNPSGDFAGRLIESAGLKGTRIGNAEISPIHANFFVNHDKTSADDVKALILQVQKTVKDKFGVNLELEVEMIGEWA